MAGTYDSKMSTVRAATVISGVIAGAFICVCSLIGAAIGVGASIIVGFVLHGVGDGDSVDGGDELAIGLFVLPMMILVPLTAISFGYGTFRIVRRVWPNPRAARR